MDFALDEQQEMLQAMARDFLAAEWPEKVLRAMSADEKGYPPALWRQHGRDEPARAFPAGGIRRGGSFLDLVAVIEEMGRACLLTPFFGTVVLGAGAIMEAGSEAQKKKYLPAIAAGEAIITLALAEESGGYTPESIQVKATRRGKEFFINGRKLFVPDAHVAGHVICVARTGDGITLFLVDISKAGVNIQPMKTISGEKLCTVDFDNVAAGPEDVLGEVRKGWPAVEKVMERAAVARSAEMVGIARQVLKITLDYAKERVAFGHPIGAFQAIQHRCADMLVDAEGARLVTYQAAWRLNQGLSAAREVAIAKSWAGQACQRVCVSAHQVHGAIGFTEDHILNLYTKKASAVASSFGDSDFWLEKLAQ